MGRNTWIALGIVGVGGFVAVVTIFLTTAWAFRAPAPSAAPAAALELRVDARCQTAPVAGVARWDDFLAGRVSGVVSLDAYVDNIEDPAERRAVLGPQEGPELLTYVTYRHANEATDVMPVWAPAGSMPLSFRGHAAITAVGPPLWGQDGRNRTVAVCAISPGEPPLRP